MEQEVKTKEEEEMILNEINRLKNKANEEFKLKKFNLALILYQEAIEKITNRNELNSFQNTPSNFLFLNNEISQLRSILYANVAACFLKLEDWQSAIQACENSLKDNQNYIKAIHRRAKANEKIATFDSLQSSLDDYNKLTDLIENELRENKNENERKKFIELNLEIISSRNYLENEIKSKLEQDKLEMLNKLKSLGNSFLNNFGISTDNFKFKPNGNSGYSMSFQH